MVGIIVIAGVLLIGGNLTWFVVEVGDVPLEVQGQSAAPALSGLALASLALAGALSLAPRVLRLVLGVLQIVLSGLALLTALPSITDPVGRVGARVTETTGIDGDESVRALVTGLTATPWPLIAVIAAAIGALLGLAVLVTSSSWPTAGRRYATTPETAAAATPSAASTPEDDWDALTRGSDPT